MPPSDKILEALRLSHENLLERTIWLNARCDALNIVVAALAHIVGQDGLKIGDSIDRAQNQAYSERLLEIERTDPALAGRLDRRKTHGEVLSDDRKILKFDDPKT